LAAAGDGLPGDQSWVAFIAELLEVQLVDGLDGADLLGRLDLVDQRAEQGRLAGAAVTRHDDRLLRPDGRAEEGRELGGHEVEVDEVGERDVDERSEEHTSEL